MLDVITPLETITTTLDLELVKVPLDHPQSITISLDTVQDNLLIMVRTIHLLVGLLVLPPLQEIIISLLEIVLDQVTPLEVIITSLDFALV